MSYTRFNSQIQHIGNTLLMSQIESNLKTYLDWSFLGIGGFTNVTVPTSGTYGGTFDTLRKVQDPAYTNGQVWEAPRKDWVWETGVEYSSQPINISGVYVDSVLKGTGDPTYAHHYNYPLGRVIFDTPITSSSTIQVNYSYRTVQTYIADQAGWWDEIQYDSLRVDDATYSQSGSGSWGILANHRVQLPAVVIEGVSRRSFRPYEQGSTASFVYQDVVFHVLAESRWWRNQLLDILSLNKDRTIALYDNNLLSSGDLYPLDYRGMRVSNPIMYPDMVDKYRYKIMRFYNMTVTEIEAPSTRLYRGTVRATVELVI